MAPNHHSREAGEESRRPGRYVAHKFKLTRIQYNIISTMHRFKKRKLGTPSDPTRWEIARVSSATVDEGHYFHEPPFSRIKTEEEVATILSTNSNQLAA